MSVMISVMYICDIYVISSVCVDGIQKTNKKVYTSHFAECNTRQIGALPSVRVITLGKEHRPGHWFRFFAECYVIGTRQRGRLCRVPHRTLGKEPDMGTLPGGLFAACPKWHSAKMDSLPSAVGQTLGKDNSFAECHHRHSAKPPSPSPGAVTAAFLCRVLCAREKVLGKEGFADALFAEPSLPSVTLVKAFAECFKASPSASGTRQSD
jgi:hypothetical protein